MGELYYFGVWVAIIIGVIKIGTTISILFSVKVQNLKKVGEFYHPFTGKFIREKQGVGSFLFYVFYLLVLAPVFSWLSVVSATWAYLQSRSHQVDAPEKIKELHFKIATIHLSKQEMEKIRQELADFMGVQASQDDWASDQNEDDTKDLNTLVLDKSDWPAKVSIDSKLKTLTFYSRTPDYESIYETVDEYRILGTEIEIRTIEDSEEEYGKVTYYIKDNVVLETVLHQKAKNHPFLADMIIEQIQKKKKAVEWNKLQRHDVKFFVLSKHPEVISQPEFRKAVRLELERIKLGVSRFLETAIVLGIVIDGEEDGVKNWSLREDLDEDQKKKCQAHFADENLKNYGITPYERDASTKIEEQLLEFLGEKKAA